MMTTSRSERRRQRTPRFNLEYLDDRIVPSAIGAEWHVAPLVSVVQVRPAAEALLAHERPEARPTDSNSTARVPLHASPSTPEHVHTTHHGGHGHSAPKAHLPARVGTRLQALYQQYESFVDSGAVGTFTPSGVSGAVVVGSDVGVDVHTTETANFPGIVAQLQGDGLQVTQDSASSGSVAGMLPIGQLPSVAKISPALVVTLPTNVGAPLQSVYAQYQAFVSAGAKGTFSPTGLKDLEISGTDVGISVHTTNIANFGKILTQLESDGLQVSQSSITYGTIDGMLPIGQLPTIATISPALSITPLFKPLMR